jgi:hypothetical protein
MRRASLILGSLAIVTVAACGGGNRADDTSPGYDTESGTMSGDTTTMAPTTGTTPMDTALTGTGMDTAGDTTLSR